MALLTAGTKTTTSLSAMIWQPAGLNTTDFAALNALMKSPAGDMNPNQTGENITYPKMRVINGRLFVPGERDDTGFLVNPGDYIMVDGAGWPFIVPGKIFSTSWQHS